VAVKVNFWSLKLLGMGWLKLNENELLTGTDTGPAARAAVFTFPP
jgi:hypothetical protein